MPLKRTIERARKDQREGKSPSTQAGADVMKRIATPMVGGIITSAILELLIYPVIYVIWRKRSLAPQFSAG